ncbi:hypothetical protein AGMMS49938_10280 [Fibrobacterales bacterium]|nr:hypothetical protein AGMMS49938_10280 [Fibrobacterales bacterium]
MPKETSFIGLDALESFGWEKRPGQICQFCSNNCNRTIVVFSDGRTHVTGNRCERGEVVASPDDPEAKNTLAEITRKINSVPDMLKRANQLLVKDYNPKIVFNGGQFAGQKIGIPRALEFFASLPFWKAFFSSLGFEVVVSRQSDYNLFEEGLHSVPSDTVCFPAKLYHGHVADLVKKKVDRIFLPIMIAVPSDHKKFQATAVCPVVQGYPAVVRNIDDPENKHNIPTDQPTFHWYNEDLRRSQCVDWFHTHWNIAKKNIDEAVSEGEKALQKFRETLQAEGQKVMNAVRARGEFAVVIAGRPYHLDPLVNHLVANHFTTLGIPVLPLEALPETFEQDIPPNTRMEALNSFHMRMLGATLLATKDPSIELVQIVSFGCGHDAILSDEIMRILHERSDKELLMLKLDEGDVRGPVSIRVKSFIETVRARREIAGQTHRTAVAEQPLFPIPYAKGDGKKRIVLIPNLSPAFSLLCAKVMEREGFRTELLPLADKRAFELGKKFVHNDICFPAQVNIGEGLRWLELHPEVSQDEVCMGLAKNCENCRAGQYAVMCRKALDEAGYPRVPILTTGTDRKNMHPGFKAGLDFQIHMLWGMAMMDGIEIMFRTVRPYEKNRGETQRVYNYWIKEVMCEAAGNIRGALKKLEKAIEAFNKIDADFSVRKPRVAVLGEILMKYHPSANGFVEEYLFEHGMEVIQPGMLDFFRVGELVRMEKVRRGMIEHPFVNWLIGGVSAKFYSKAASDVNKRIKKFKFYEHHANCYEMADIIEKTGMLDRTYVTGEGWLIPGEIMSLAEHGVNSFVIVQPFACLANHISGRGLTKAVKNKFPHIQILSLDYDPDTSFANIENRLQMLIINAKELEEIQAHS